MEQEIIDWVNQVEPTSTIDDLKSGVGLCYLLNRELFQDKRLCELKTKVIKCNKNDHLSSLKNLAFALQMLEQCNQGTKHLSAEMLYKNPLKCLQLIANIKQRNTKPPLPPKAEELFYVEDVIQPEIQHQALETVANKYKMIRPYSPYQKTNDSYFNSQSVQSVIDKIPEVRKSSGIALNTVTHNTEYVESDREDRKLKELEQEIKNLDGRITKEQQSLKKIKQTIETHQVDFEDKRLIVNWLKEIRLIKASAVGLEAKMSKICRNGVIFFDLINRLSGREEVLKGALRNPKNLQQTKHNYRRVLEYLKQFERMNYRFLNSEIQLAEGNDDYFWGLLQDIKALYQGQKETLLSDILAREIHDTSKVSKQVDEIKDTLNNTLNNTLVKDPSSKIFHSPGSYSHMHSQKQENDSINKSRQKSSQATPISNSRLRNKSGSNQRQRSLSITKGCVTREMELYVQNDLKSKNLYNNEHLFTDPIRNGSYILQLLNGSSPNTFTNILDVERCIHDALSSVRALVDAGSLPPWISSIKNTNIMQLDKLTMGLYWHLLKLQNHQPNNQVTNYVLPYKQEAIDQLKHITLHWARETMQNDTNINSFNDFILRNQNGVLLCQLISAVLKQKIIPIHQNPIGEKQCLANIRKGLDALKTKEVGQRFLWKEAQIYEGDQLVIIGLYEDVRMFQDGLAQRRGEDYFADGPYLKQPIQQTKQYSIEIQQKPLSLIDQNQQIQVNKKLVFEEEQSQQSYDWIGAKVNWNNPVLEEFKDGLILVNLISRLEQKQFRGINQKPTTMAACVSNIRKALISLKDRIDMPIQVFMDQDKVAQGDKEYILKLLNVIKVIYKNKIRKN